MHPTVTLTYLMNDMLSAYLRIRLIYIKLRWIRNRDGACRVLFIYTSYAIRIWKHRFYLLIRITFSLDILFLCYPSQILTNCISNFHHVHFQFSFIFIHNLILIHAFNYHLQSGAASSSSFWVKFIIDY